MRVNAQITGGMLLAMAICVLVSTAAAQGATLSVPRDYRTIQAALNNARSGDRILIEPGVYRENIVIPNEGLLLTGTDPDDPTVVAKTVIDGSREGPVITVRHVDITIRGSTITNGSSNVGAGVFAEGSSLRIESCHILNNTTNDGDWDIPPFRGGDGAGIYLNRSTASITD